MTIDPFLSALSADYVLPPYQPIANAALIAVFAYLVPLLTMEINYFRLAVYKSWRRQVRREGKEQRLAALSAAAAKAAATVTPATTVTVATIATNTTTSESNTKQVATAAAGAAIHDYNFNAIIQNNETINEDEEEWEDNDSNKEDDYCHNSTISHHSSSFSSDDSFSSSAVGHLMNDVHSHIHHYCYGALHLHNNNKNEGDYDDENDVTYGKDFEPITDDKCSNHNNNFSINNLGSNSSHVGSGGVSIVNDQLLHRAYLTIRSASMQAVLSSMFLYSITAAGVAINTRGLDPKVIAIIIGASQFMTALMVVIVTAKVPQWVRARASEIFPQSWLFILYCYC